MLVLAHAKVNFTLEVLSLRSDGYHGLRSVVLPISLCDTVELDESEGFSSDSGFADDLCLKAARATDARRGVRVRVTKRIPVGGGLGGGSADAAAVIRGLNEMRGLGKSPAELAEIGASVGSDVPALVLNAPVLMEGRGEKVVPIAAGSMDLVLVDPGVHCSTGEVYSACRPRADAGASKTAQMVAALSSGGFDEVVAALANDLQEPAVRRAS